MLTFLRAAHLGIQYIAAGVIFWASLMLLPLSHLGDHATGGNGGATAISHKAGVDNGVTIYLEPYLHGIATWASNPGKAIGVLKLPQVPRIHAVLNDGFGVYLSASPV